MFYSIINIQKYEKDIDLICKDFHDSICINANYDMCKQRIEMHIETYYHKTIYCWTFNKVKLIFSTNFNIWGYSGERFHEVTIIDNDEIISSLNNLRTTSYGDSKEIILSNLKNLIGLHFLSVSGNEIFIICESINIEPDISVITQSY